VTNGGLGPLTALTTRDCQKRNMPMIEALTSYYTEFSVLLGNNPMIAGAFSLWGSDNEREYYQQLLERLAG